MQHAENHRPVLAGQPLFQSREPSAHRVERRTDRFGGNDSLDAVNRDRRLVVCEQGFLQALTGPPRDHDHIGAWAWVDAGAGTIRARVFPLRYGIAEDEATGSAAAILCAQLERAIEIRQGRGSLIRARPLEGGFVEVGGASVLDEVREL